jgi:hypothetical protein
VICPVIRSNKHGFILRIFTILTMMNRFTYMIDAPPDDCEKWIRLLFMFTLPLFLSIYLDHSFTFDVFIDHTYHIFLFVSCICAFKIAQLKQRLYGLIRPNDYPFNVFLILQASLNLLLQTIHL